MNNHAELVQFVLEQSAAVSPVKRARILRGLAAVCGEQWMERELKGLAAQLDEAGDALAEADRKMRDVQFSFVQTIKG